MPTIGIKTLGCKVNQYETEQIIDGLLESGFSLVQTDEPVDIFVINSCTVTRESDKKSRQAIRRAIRNNPESFIIVTGCYTEKDSGEVLAIPGVDLIIKNREKDSIAKTVSERIGFNRQKLATPLAAPGVKEQKLHTRALLKVQDGCDQFCSFCIVPYVRGKPRSENPEDVIIEAEQLIKSGTKELVITGINLGKYGQDLPSHTDLADVLSKISAVPGIARIRLSSIDVKELTPKLVSLISSNQVFCRHLHIPLQSGSNTILKKMNRSYSREFYIETVENAKKQIPEIAITTDVVVGFPGETKGDFELTKELIKLIGFKKVHVFRYSLREGTQAAKLNDTIASSVKEGRARELIQLSDKLGSSFMRRYIGGELEVLVEKRRKDGLLNGFSSNYIRTYCEGPEQLKGELVRVQIESMKDGNLYGKIKNNVK